MAQKSDEYARRRARANAKMRAINGTPAVAKREVLPEKEARAVEYYLRGHSKTRALRMAGYAESTAVKLQFRIFARERVQREIEIRRRELRIETNDMISRIKGELAKIAFFNIGHLLLVDDDGGLVFDFTSATVEEFAALGAVEVEVREIDGKEVRTAKVKPIDKKGALDSLARIYGLFQDNLNVSAEGDSIEDRLQRGRERLRRGVDVEGEVLEDG